MNDDFEAKLLELSAAGQRPDLTAGWKDDILSRALAHARSGEGCVDWQPPRWLLSAWGAAWAACFVLHAATPESSLGAGGPEIRGTAFSMFVPQGGRDGSRFAISASMGFPTETKLP